MLNNLGATTQVKGLVRMYGPWSYTWTRSTLSFLGRWALLLKVTNSIHAADNV